MKIQTNGMNRSNKMVRAGIFSGLKRSLEGMLDLANRPFKTLVLTCLGAVALAFSTQQAHAVPPSTNILYGPYAAGTITWTFNGHTYNALGVARFTNGAVGVWDKLTNHLNGTSAITNQGGIWGYDNTRKTDLTVFQGTNPPVSFTLLSTNGAQYSTVVYNLNNGTITNNARVYFRTIGN